MRGIIIIYRNLMNSVTKLKGVKQYLPDRGQILQIVLISIWVLFQYGQGNELYALFMILFFFALSVYRSRNFTLIITSVLVIILFKMPVLDSWIEIREANLATFHSFKPSISRLLTPDSGRDVLPTTVQQMLSLLQENKITEYRLSDTFEQDPLIQQRIIESAWPAKKNAASPYLLCSIGEFKNMTACIDIVREKDVILVYCP